MRIPIVITLMGLLLLPLFLIGLVTLLSKELAVCLVMITLVGTILIILYSIFGE